jgi:hypothetical protein
MLLPINTRKELDMTDKRFLMLFSNYSHGDRYPALVPSRSGGVCGGTVLSVAPVAGVEASQPGTVQSVDLMQRPSEYRASSGVMKEILQKSVSADTKARNEKVRAPRATTKKEKQGREIGERVKRAKEQVASAQTIVSDYNKLKSKKSKQDFVSALGEVYSQNPTGSKYILDGIEMIKAL